ncbi:MAG: hypothetical protein COA42_14125 [Alteromonadaceae bacterium]|nr:MAG: hypothetical protein COA42_14125 [Alteromonadaceae bacterium]
MLFRSQFLWRLYTAYVAITIVSTALMGALIIRQVTESSMRDIDQSLAVRTEFLAQVTAKILENDSKEQLQQTLEHLGRKTQSRLTVVSFDGLVIADSRGQASLMDNHGDRPEIIDAKRNGFGVSSRFSNTLEQNMIYRAQQITPNTNTNSDFVRVSLPLSAIDEKLSQLRAIIAISVIIVTLAALILGFYFAKRVSDRISKLSSLAEVISQGEYEKRIQTTQQDELGKLAEAFNRMARNTSDRIAKVSTEHKRLTTIFRGMVEGVIDVDQEQKIVHINHAAAKLLKLSTETCINKPIGEQIRSREIKQALEQAISTQVPVKAQMRLKQGSEALVLDVYVAVLYNDKNDSIGAVIVLHDVSELDHLEHIRRDFVANASHELKTPITAIRGLTETMLDDKQMDSETRDNFLSKIQAQNLRLSALVSDLMTISRLESDESPQNFQSINIAEATLRSISTNASTCQEKQLDVAVDIQDQYIFINGDIQTINQLIDNLIVNAVKYTASGGQITVKVCRTETEAILSVTDTGVGITPYHQLRIFERFYRVDKGRSRELGGTGLGLSIVKNIADRHRGAVGVESTVGKGSTFTFRLPLLIIDKI